MSALAAPMPNHEVASWEHQSHLELAAITGAVPSARLHARLILREWGLESFSDTAELLMSELVTNALRASSQLRIRADLPMVPVIHVWIVVRDAAVFIHVWDSSPEMPVRQEISSIDQESGRGLMIVDALSKEWGVYEKDGGKVVWAMLTGGTG
jgi:anti-sigma regulatory factor (Ser/Thr protein kinase)